MSLSDLRNLAHNHVQNPDLPYITYKAAVSLAELEKFIDMAKTHNADALQIFFVRFPIDGANTKNEKILHAGKNLSQISLVFAPGIITEQNDWIIETVRDGDSVLTLPVCDPGFDEDRATGLCPPKGNPSDLEAHDS